MRKHLIVLCALLVISLPAMAQYHLSTSPDELNKQTPEEMTRNGIIENHLRDTFVYIRMAHSCNKKGLMFTDEDIKVIDTWKLDGVDKTKIDRKIIDYYLNDKPWTSDVDDQSCRDVKESLRSQIQRPIYSTIEGLFKGTKLDFK
ncbi:hypothetical protein ABDF71_09880 [Ochrobactrum sp. WV_118_8]